MNFKNKYNIMNQNIKPEEKIKSDTLNNMRTMQKTNYRMITVIAASIFVSCVFIVLAAVGVFSNNTQKKIAAKQPPNTSMQTASLPSPALSQETAAIELTDEPVKYSELGLNLPSIQYPQLPESTACLAAFDEDMIMYSNLIIKGTIRNVRFNKYFLSQVSAVYEIQIDDIFYSEEDFKIGETIIIEQNLYMGTSIQDSVVGLKQGGQYIFPIAKVSKMYAYAYYTEFLFESDLITKDARIFGIPLSSAKERESRFEVIYPHMPPIQVVPNIGYLYPESWKSLVTNATPIQMDEQISSETLYSELYIRDESFIDDFNKLIEMYVNDEYRKTNVHSNDWIIENGKVKTTKQLAVLYAAYFPDPILNIDIKKCEQSQTGDWIVKYTKQDSKKIFIKNLPQYLDIPTEQKLISYANKYLAFNYENFRINVIFESDGFIVEYFDENDNIKVCTKMNIIGCIIEYLIF